MGTALEQHVAAQLLGSLGRARAVHLCCVARFSLLRYDLGFFVLHRIIVLQMGAGLFG